MQNDRDRFDVAIIGSGIAGSTLGAILARQGLSVILFEARSHPKFAIGESMILETSEVMRSLAKLYDVPELAYFSSENYFEHIGTSHGLSATLALPTIQQANSSIGSTSCRLSFPSNPTVTSCTYTDKIPIIS